MWLYGAEMVWLQRKWIMALHICVMILSIVFQWPWQTVHGPGLERQHWQHHILEQTKRLSRIMGCCCSHVIWEGVVLRNKMGVCLDMTMPGTPSPLAMEDDTGKGESTQKQVPLAPENGSKGWPPERECLIPLKDVDCVHTIHDRNSHPPPTNVLTKALIRQCYERNLRCICFWLVLTLVLFLHCHL